jgi:glutathione synthase/RimK-type ligase-like ATP-grasp enzyme
LDFGGVDIGWNQRHGAAVFEVNTAPGIEETSLQAYVEAFKTL